MGQLWLRAVDTWNSMLRRILESWPGSVVKIPGQSRNVHYRYRRSNWQHKCHICIIHKVDWFSFFLWHPFYTLQFNHSTELYLFDAMLRKHSIIVAQPGYWILLFVGDGIGEWRRKWEDWNKEKKAQDKSWQIKLEKRIGNRKVCTKISCGFLSTQLKAGQSLRTKFEV